MHKKVTRLHHRRHHHHQQHSVADFLKAQFAIFRQNFVGSCHFFLVVIASCYNARIQRREQSFSLIYNTHYFDSCIDDIHVYTGYFFQIFLPIFITKMKNKLQPTGTTFSRNFHWLSKFFHFGTENVDEQVKKHPV